MILKTFEKVFGYILTNVPNICAVNLTAFGVWRSAATLLFLDVGNVNQEVYFLKHNVMSWLYESKLKLTWVTLQDINLKSSTKNTSKQLNKNNLKNQNGRLCL